MSVNIHPYTLVSAVVEKDDFDKFVEKVNSDKEVTDKCLTDMSNDITDNKRETDILNDGFTYMYREQSKLEDRIKGLIISNIITAVGVIAGIVLAIVL